VPEQVIGHAAHVPGEHGHQFTVLARPGSHEVAGFLGPRQLPIARGQQGPPDLRKSRITCQLKQAGMEVRVRLEVFRDVTAESRSHGGVGQLPDDRELLIAQPALGQLSKGG